MDVGTFDATEQNYKIPVPRHQQLNADTADLIAQIAQSAPPSLMAQLAIPPALAQRDAEVRGAIEARNTATMIREALDTADALWLSGFRYRAISLARDTFRGLVREGQGDQATAPLIRWLGRLLDEARDPQAALDLLQMVDAEAAGGSARWLSTIAGVDGFRVRVLAARAEALLGNTRAARELAAHVATEPTLQEVPEFIADAALLSAVAALANEQYLEAAEAFERLAAIRVVGTHDTKAQQRARNRGAFALGLAGERAAAIQALHDAPPGDETYVAMALSWLLADDGDLTAAAASAMRVPAQRMAGVDGYALLRAYRVAGWADRQAFVFRQPEPYDTVAFRLEALVRAREPQASMHERLLDRADEALRRSKAGEAFAAAHQARVAALDRADVAAYREARERIAGALRAAVLHEPRLEQIEAALTETAATLEEAPKTTELRLFLREVSEQLTGDSAARALAALRRSIGSTQSAIAALRLAAVLGKRWVFTGRDAAIADLLINALRVPAGGLVAGQLIAAVEELLGAITPPLAEDAAARVRDAVIEFAPNAPVTSVDDLLRAIARTTTTAAPPADGGLSLTSFILDLEETAQRGHATVDWLQAVASTARRLTGEQRARLEEVLIERAMPTINQSVSDWNAVMMLLVARMDPGALHPNGATAVAEAYLEHLESVLELSFAEVGAGQYGFRWADLGPLTSWAIPHAQVTLRMRVGSRAAAFLMENGHILQSRQQWIPFLARLGATTPELAPIALAALQAAARGELRGIGGFDEFMDPLSQFHNVGHSADRVQAHAVAWTALLLTSADTSVANAVLAGLQDAATSDAHRIRAAVAYGLAWASREVEEGRASMSDTIHRGVGTILKKLAQDHVPTVSLPALRTIAGLVTEGDDDDE